MEMKINELINYVSFLVYFLFYFNNGSLVILIKQGTGLGHIQFI